MRVSVCEWIITMANDRGHDESLDDPFADPFNEDDTSDMEFVSVGGSTLNFQQDLHEPYDSDDSEFGGVSRTQSVGGGRTAQVDPSQLFGINKEALQAVTQQGNQRRRQSRILSTPKKSAWERAMHTTGIMYLSGLVLGGSVGLVRGFAKSPSPRPRILLNSILNGCGRGGSTVGNTLGSLGMSIFVCIYFSREHVSSTLFVFFGLTTAMIYSGCEWILDKYEFDTAPDYLGLKRREIYTQMTAAAMTGMIYRLPAYSKYRAKNVCSV